MAYVIPHETIRNHLLQNAEDVKSRMTNARYFERLRSESQSSLADPGFASKLAKDVNYFPSKVLHSSRTNIYNARAPHKSLILSTVALSTTRDKKWKLAQDMGTGVFAMIHEAREKGAIITTGTAIVNGEKIQVSLEDGLLDWITMAMAKSQKDSPDTVPKTLYLRPRVFWETGAWPADGVGRESTIMKFSRTFQWDITESKTFPGMYVLLAVMTSWISSASPPICYGFWTYITEDGRLHKFTSNENYLAEKMAMEERTRELSFDTQGEYKDKRRFTISAYSYITIGPGTLVAMLASAELYPGLYAATTLDMFESGYFKPFLDGVEHSLEDKDLLNLFLYSVTPLMNIAELGSEQTKELHYAALPFSPRVHIPEGTPRMSLTGL